LASGRTPITDVDDALYFLQRSDPSWTEVYKAFEIARSDVGEIAGSSWASQRELTRFTRTATTRRRRAGKRGTPGIQASHLLIPCR